MSFFTGVVVSAGLVFTTAAAQAQALAPYEIGNSSYVVVSDVDGPYATGPSEVPAPRYGPTLLPAPEVYTIVRENGFSPLGIPQLHGIVYTIAVIDRDGDDGRLIVDARTGRIIRFIPAYRMGDNFNEGMTVTYGPAGLLPPIGTIRGVPRPPASVPRVASHTPSVPLPKEPPPHTGDVKPLAAKPAAEPPQQSAAVQTKPVDAPASPQAVAPIEAKPAAPQIRPTQEMPTVQGLE